MRVRFRELRPHSLPPRAEAGAAGCLLLVLPSPHRQSPSRGVLVTAWSVTLKTWTNLHMLIRDIHCTWLVQPSGEHRVVCSDGQGRVHRYRGPSKTQGQLTDQQAELESLCRETCVCIQRPMSGRTFNKKSPEILISG